MQCSRGGLRGLRFERERNNFVSHACRVAAPLRSSPSLSPSPSVLSASAASFGEFCTIPFDTAKVRLQMQDRANPVYRGLFHTLSSMFKQEGIRAPWKGVTAGIQRQCAFAPIRIGLYEPVRNFYVVRRQTQTDTARS